MEESEKRRERLKAMQMEASQGGNVSESLGMVSPGLCNPLIECETASAVPSKYSSPRFDYYTDPMSAFSGNKRSSQVSPQVLQQYYNTPPRPRHPDASPTTAYQHPSMNSPGQRISPAPRAYNNYVPFGSPSASPSGRNPQSTWGGAVGTSSCNYSSNLSGGSNFSPGFGRRGSPNTSYSHGRGQSYNSNPLYGSGYGTNPYPGSGGSVGRSSGYNTMSPGSGHSGRKVAGLHGPTSAELRPDLYYSHGMVGDPWKELTPVIWKGPNVNANSDKSWLPESISTKKPRVSSEALNNSSSGPSLAEYLASSFSEVANNESGDE